jgi:colicin import membrane protein
MPGFFREHLRPLAGSALLHLLLVATVAGLAIRWTTSQPPEQLAIEGVIMDPSQLPRPAKGRQAETPVPEAPRPVPQTVPPVEDPGLQAREKAAATERARVEAEALERELRDRQAAQRRAAEEAEQQRAAEEARRKAAAEEARKKAEAEEARRKAEAEEAQRRKEAEQKAAREAKLKAEREAQLMAALTAEEEATAIAQSGVVDEYRMLLTQTIERNWIRPPSAQAGLECELDVTQATGGTVIDVRIGRCNGDQAVRESITNAVYRSSPLPAPPDPRAFQRKLKIVFKPRE